MNSRTARRPDSQRATRSATTRKYVRQTAHVGTRRDGKPLLFGWGGHLSHSEKQRLQRRAIWTVTTVFVFFIIAVFIGFWVNINVISPNQPITTVNGQNIPQSDYRKMVAVQAQFHLNKIKGPQGLQIQQSALQRQITSQETAVNNASQQIKDLDAQMKKLAANTGDQRTNLEKQLKAAQTQYDEAQKKYTELNLLYQNLIQAQIPLEEQRYTQSQVANDSVEWLQQDALIRHWLAKQSSSVRAQVSPSPSATKQALNAFSADFPKGTTYQKYLSENNISDSDVQAMLAVKLRRENMQEYLAAQIKSPTYQVLARAMTLQTQAAADKILASLKKGEDFGKLAREKSVDSTTKDGGGDLGWLARGQYSITYAQQVSGAIDNWIFASSRKLNELSPVLSEGGTFHIVQIMGLDTARKVDESTLKNLKDNALTIWVLAQKATPGVAVTAGDQNIMFDPINMPASLPISPPQQNPSGAGLPGLQG